MTSMSNSDQDGIYNQNGIIQHRLRKQDKHLHVFIKFETFILKDNIHSKNIHP